MSETRNTRKTLVGNVTSRSGDKSIKVTIPFKVPHPRYKKVINRQTVLHVHDEKNETHVGDKVEVMETRPISRLKRWRVVKVLHVAAGVEDHAISEQDVAAQVPTKTTKTNETAPTA
jgi:small subunit ribosomal protein S17